LNLTVEIEPEQKTNNDVEQRLCGQKDKYRLLQDILRDEPIKS
jgi:ATP-dependent RNA helicase RhlB